MTRRNQGSNTIGSRNNNNKKHVQDKGKRKIFESTKTEQSYKFKEDPLVERVDLNIESNRQQRNRRGE